MKIKALFFTLSLMSATHAFAHPPQTANDYFKLLPVSAFDDTSEGLTEDDKTALLAKSDSPSWTLKKVSDSKVVVTCKTPASEVSLTLKPLDGEILETLTKNQQVIKYSYWKLADDKLSLQSYFPNALIRAANETTDGSQGMPLTAISEDVKKHIQTLEMCAHWSGEPAEDNPARAQEILKNLQKLDCAHLPDKEKSLRAQFKTDTQTLKILDKAKALVDSGN